MPSSRKSGTDQPTWEEFYSVQRQARDALTENERLRGVVHQIAGYGRTVSAERQPTLSEIVKNANTALAPNSEDSQ